ncbi:4-(cytidine 5'-diphospho)-2-C-methyl-D-erythritol kinase [Sphingomonas sp.]|uniref:4-(cytidine 5'-diphospho)-2-C-methyl-D-erythritol kinase n=1 Tax=Sphingomonas sp. TaxID=28214 RepID=UPI00286D7267|nr:4-(cytidine 5'-diphospho)-2-C-methyl-D-erythritol kinase [Sphingomonas sp.]
MTAQREAAPAKLNLALHVRGKLPDGRHRIETIFAFCEDGDELTAEPAEDVSLALSGPFAGGLGEDNLVLKAARALQLAAAVMAGAALSLDKRLPVASGVGGGSADAAAALRLLTRLWDIDAAHAEQVAPTLGSDVPACLAALPARGDGAGDQLTPIDILGLGGTPVLLVNPRLPLSTAAVFARWDGVDRGPLAGWRDGRNDLEAPATALVPEIADMLAWLRDQPDATFVRMSGSGATCFALFDNIAQRDAAAAAVPTAWWHLATRLR